MFVYLAHPIDHVKSPEHKSAVQTAKGWAMLALDHAGHTVFHPSRAYQQPPFAVAEDEAKIHKANLAVLEQADAVLAILPQGVPSVGVPMEMHHAYEYGIPVVLLTNGLPSVSLRHFQYFRAEEADAAVAWLESQQRGWTIDQAVPIEDEPAPPAVLVQRLHTASQLPTRAHNDDCGYDLHVIGDHRLLPGDKVDLPCGIAMEFPDGAWGLLVGRSSALRKLGLRVLPGIIDNGYRGELFAFVENATSEVVKVSHGQRIAQIIPLPTLASRWPMVEVTQLTESARGTKGFGSSGH